MQPPLLVASLKADKMESHLISSDPHNALVTTMTSTARLISRAIGRLDQDILLLDATSTHWRTGNTAFRNSRILRMRLKSARGLRWVTLKVFRNGTLHITGHYGVDICCFVLEKLCEALNALYDDKTVHTYCWLMGDTLLTNYRMTLGRRIGLTDLASLAVTNDFRAHLDPRDTSVNIKWEVDNGAWGSIRVFATGNVIVSLPRVSLRARTAAFVTLLNFLQSF